MMKLMTGKSGTPYVCIDRGTNMLSFGSAKSTLILQGAKSDNSIKSKISRTAFGSSKTLTIPDNLGRDSTQST